MALEASLQPTPKSIRATLMRALLLQSFLEKMVYPATLLGLGLVGNKYIVRGEVKEEFKGVKAEVKKLAEQYSSMELSMAGLLTRQSKLEELYKATVARIFKGCKAKEEKE